MQSAKPNDRLNWFRASQGRSALVLSLYLCVSVLCTFVPMAAQAQYYGRGWGPYAGPYGPYGGPGAYEQGAYGQGPYGPGPYGPPGPYRGPPPLDPDDVGPNPDMSAEPGPGRGPSARVNAAESAPRTAGPISAEAIEARVRSAGYRLIAPPRHKGKIYLAEVDDSKSVRRRLVYDANDGHLLENTPLGPVKKPGAAIAN